jgi:hypothetical protein
MSTRSVAAKLQPLEAVTKSILAGVEERKPSGTPLQKVRSLQLLQQQQQQQQQQQRQQQGLACCLSPPACAVRRAWGAPPSVNGGAPSFPC